MCLIRAKIKETAEDITCYKLYISFEGELRSLFRRSLAPNMNEIAKTYLEKPYDIGNYVDRGFHSFANLEDALQTGANISRLYNNIDIVVIKCIIPKDSKCYVGSFWGMTSYCSDSIKLIELIKTYI